MLHLIRLQVPLGSTNGAKKSQMSKYSARKMKSPEPGNPVKGSPVSPLVNCIADFSNLIKMIFNFVFLLFSKKHIFHLFFPLLWFLISLISCIEPAGRKVKGRPAQASRGGEGEDWWLFRQRSRRCSSPRTRCLLTCEISPNRKNKVPNSVPACFLPPSGGTGPFRLFVNKQELIKGTPDRCTHFQQN